MPTKRMLLIILMPVIGVILSAALQQGAATQSQRKKSSSVVFRRKTKDQLSISQGDYFIVNMTQGGVLQYGSQHLVNYAQPTPAAPAVVVAPAPAVAPASAAIPAPIPAPVAAPASTTGGLNVVGLAESLGATPTVANMLSCIAWHESRDEPGIVNSSGNAGLFQFSYTTWVASGGSGSPSQASPSYQVQIAYQTYLKDGWSPWQGDPCFG